MFDNTVLLQIYIIILLSHLANRVKSLQIISIRLQIGWTMFLNLCSQMYEIFSHKT